MTTKVKTKDKMSAERETKPDEIVLPHTVWLKDGEYAQINPDDIEFSPLNYRKYFSEEALQQFAEELKLHGMISPIRVRLTDSGKYELVVGERRLRAARIAGLPTIPAVIHSLTDEQVIEIQLAENLQRENPHPMHEAGAIGQLQRSGKTIDEIAARLGKSKQFVYARLKLLSLIDAFQEMLLADVMNLQEALQIAALSADSQTDFFTNHCINWKKQKGFELPHLGSYLNQYRYDLKRAPFNTKDKNLVPEAGACTNCPSNSATLKSLFPELAKQAICSNKACYHNKCTLHLKLHLADAIQTYQPAALLYQNQLSELAEQIISLVPGASDLLRHNIHEVMVIREPDCPDKEDFTYSEDGENPELDEQEFNSAMEHYTSKREAYDLHVKSGHYAIAIPLDNRWEFKPVYFSMERPRNFDTRKQAVTAKEVQAALKSGTATAELLQAEVNRIQQREKRAQELDTEKVQLTIHSQFTEFVAKSENNTAMTQADLTGARLLIFQSLDYQARQEVTQTLLSTKGNRKAEASEQLYERLSNLTDQEFSYLVRMAVCCKSDSKYPTQLAGYFLYRMAAEAGIPVKAVEDAQKQKREERKERLEGKIRELKKQLKKLNKK